MPELSPFTAALTGRLSFTFPAAPVHAPLPPGRYDVGIAEERDTVLIVPEGLDTDAPVPLFVMFHGAGGFADKVLPFVLKHARARRILLLLPQSKHETWDIVIAGNGPDLERLDRALTNVASHFELDRAHIAFAGFSDGGSYALSAGIANGDIASHVIAFSAGFMTPLVQNGTPKVFFGHGTQDEQTPIRTSAWQNAGRLLFAGYDVEAVEFDGPHEIRPEVVQQAMDFFLPDFQSQIGRRSAPALGF